MEVRKIEKKKPRVALLIDAWFPVFSGEQIHVAKLARALVEEGYEVDILTRKAKGSVSREERGFERMDGVEIARLNAWRVIYIAQVIFKLITARERYALWHAHTTAAAIAMKVASWFSKIPTVVTVHGGHVFQKGVTLKKLIDRVIYTETEYSQEISVAESFLKAKNVNEHVLVIPSGIDVEPFDAVKDGRDPERFTGIYVGRLEYGKGVDTLILAVKKFVESNDFVQNKKDFLLNIVGDGIDRSGLEKLTEKLELSKYVRFHGKVTGEALIELYKGADLFVLPSRFDGLPLPLLEACAARLPILATNVWDNKKLVLDNVNGHLIAPDDAHELSYYLGYFALNPHLEQMGDASYDLVVQEYNWETTAKKLLRIYSSLIKEKKDGQNITSRAEEFMPWQLPKILLKQRTLKKAYRGRAPQELRAPKERRAPLKFCFTVNITQAYAPGELPHEVTHLEAFFERLVEFCESSELPGTLFVQTDLFEPFRAEVKAVQKEGHEIGIFALKKDWRAAPEKKKFLRKLNEDLKEWGWGNLNMFRSPEVADEDLAYIHESKFEFLPVSEDPKVHVRFRRGLPFGHVVKMDLRNFLQMDNEELLASVHRLMAYQRENGVAPFLIFESNSWEFQSREHTDYASGENFGQLARRLSFLRENMEISFMTLSDFCKSCKTE